jgi:hypothetical protein
MTEEPVEFLSVRYVSDSAASKPGQSQKPLQPWWAWLKRLRKMYLPLRGFKTLISFRAVIAALEALRHLKSEFVRKLRSRALPQPSRAGTLIRVSLNILDRLMIALIPSRQG